MLPFNWQIPPFILQCFFDFVGNLRAFFDEKRKNKKRLKKAIFSRLSNWNNVLEYLQEGYGIQFVIESKKKIER